MTHRLALILVVAALGGLVVVTTTVKGSGPPDVPAPGRRVWHVSAEARPGGDGSVAHPFRTIAEGLAPAQPDDTVAVGPGTYAGFSTVRPGLRRHPVSIVGTSAAIRGNGKGHLVEVRHDHVTVQGFEIAHADILVWVFHATGVKVAANVIRDARGECVRLKYFSSDNEVTGNRIERCGGAFDAADEAKNGEGIYIGTSPEQLDRNPTKERDASSGNWIHDNDIASPAECVDIKEGASANLVEGNVCTGGEDPDGAGLSARGSGNVFRNNTSSDHKGAGIRLGGDRRDDGIDNVVVWNRFMNNQGYGVKVQRQPQRQICGNIVAGDGSGTTNGETDPRRPC